MEERANTLEQEENVWRTGGAQVGSGHGNEYSAIELQGRHMVIGG